MRSWAPLNELVRERISPFRCPRAMASRCFALVIWNAPVRCAMELSRTLGSATPRIHLRMGVNTGPVYCVSEIKANSNLAGGGINIARRVMDGGDAGDIFGFPAARPKSFTRLAIGRRTKLA